MYYLDAENRMTRELAPGVHARIFWADRMMLSLVNFEPDAVVPAHSHPHEQAGVVMAGKVRFEIDGQVQVLGAGQMYLIPGGVEHSALAIGPGAQVLDIFSPLREDLLD